MKITKQELRKVIREEISYLSEQSDLFLKIRDEFPTPPKGADLRSERNIVQVFYYGQNRKAKDWADAVKKKYPKGVRYIDTSKMSDAEEKEWNVDNKRYLSGKQ
jgi:hypothetical protein